ncbi:MAG: hypothetical protein AMXMBFR33_18890 [Candidatus Xenobia bacterium]|jgi:ribosomal protein L29
MDEIRRQIRAVEQELQGLDPEKDRARVQKLQLELARLRAQLRTEGSEEYYWSEER